MCSKCRPHCHWTFRHGKYASPWYYPTREDAERSANCGPSDPRFPDPPEVYQVHTPGCACETEMEPASV